MLCKVEEESAKTEWGSIINEVPGRSQARDVLSHVGREELCYDCHNLV